MLGNYNKIGDKCTPFLTKLKNLISLHIIDQKISENGINEIFDSCKSLKYLNISMIMYN